MPVKIKGSVYYTVAERLRLYRESHLLVDGWALTTELLRYDGTDCIVKSSLIDPDGRVVSTGHAHERKEFNPHINATSMLENAETSACGRALANGGFFGDGTTAICSAEEMKRALAKREIVDSMESIEEDQSEDEPPSDVVADFPTPPPLGNYGLTTKDVDKWSESRNFLPWKEWTDHTKTKFLNQLKDGELVAKQIKAAGAR